MVNERILPYTLASIWRRVVAVLIDSVIIFLFIYLTISFNMFKNQILFFIIYILSILSPLIYFISLETIYGQTIGKRLLKIKVLRKDGSKIDFRAGLLRNVLRLVDMLPFFYVVGVISILLTQNMQRIGDFAAGTIVVDYKK